MKPRGGWRERAGRPPKDSEAVTIKLRRCRKCGRFASVMGHVCHLERRCERARSREQAGMATRKATKEAARLADERHWKFEE